MSGCKEILSPGVMAASLFQSGAGAGTARDPGTLIQRCPDNPGPRLDPASRKAIDDALICKAACCCLNNPLVGGTNQDLMQGCMEEAFKNADKLLGYNSRYKAEISYDMTQRPPSPLMHRENGQDTTEPSQYWQGRAKQEIENYRKGRGMVRRPDLVIVDDPCLPPSQDNIERVLEFKFRNDQRDDKQDAAYRRIAGDDDKYSIFRIGAPPKDDEQSCNCGQQQTPELIPVPASEQEKQSALGAAGSALGWGAATVVGTAATAALLLSPFDGPAGEMAAGSATAAAASRAASAWKVFSAAY
jgi:hypothetical protein